MYTNSLKLRLSILRLILYFDAADIPFSFSQCFCIAQGRLFDSTSGVIHIPATKARRPRLSSVLGGDRPVLGDVDGIGLPSGQLSLRSGVVIVASIVVLMIIVSHIGLTLRKDIGATYELDPCHMALVTLAASRNTASR